MLWSKITPSAKLYLKYFLLIFLVAMSFRLIFNVWNIPNLKDVSWQVITKAFYLGTKFDLRISQVFALPFLILIFIPKIKLLSLKVFRYSFYFLVNTLFILYILIYFHDFGFYSYLGARLNASILKFFETPDISLNMVWESYPVVWIILGLIFIVYLHHKFLVHIVGVANFSKDRFSFKNRALINFLCFLFFAITAYGKFSWFPLRWSEAYFSPEPMASKLAINPIHHLFDTLKYHDKKDYDIAAVKKYYEESASYLGVEDKDLENLNFTRKIDGKTSNLKNFNIVMIMMESLSYNKTSLSENPLDPSPYLKQIASESILFTQHYTPTVATARGVFASIISAPDMTPGKGSSSRNPFIVNQHSVINYFNNYQRFYFLGGSANWGNIRGLFTNNIQDIKVYEEGSYKSPRADVWGISDIDLFIEANEVLKNTKEPFFAFIQTASFHRPFTIPENSYGFENKNVSNEELTRYGFDSLEEYNSMRFMDHSLEHFIKIAKASGYYDNTLFVIYGDHGIPTNRSEHMNEGYIKHGLTSYHVPLLFHAPKVLKHRIETKMASQVDIVPTIASLTGTSYKIKTLGRDLFDEKYDNSRYAFVYSWFANPLKFGLIGDEFYYAYDAGKAALYRYRSKDFFNDVSQQETETFSKMDKLAQGLLEANRYIMHFNTIDDKK